MTPVVSVVVVSYQTRELIITALATLRAACPAEPYEVIVVDNASTDGSAAAVAAAFPEARVLRLARNVGFGRAVNVGAARARGEWLLLLNPDTEPVGNVIGELLAFTRAHPGHGIYAGRTLAPDGSDDGHSVFGPPSLWTLTCFATGLSKLLPRSRLFNREALPWLDRSASVRVPAASGCLLLVRRTLFAQLGGFTPDYFMYSEDLDLCLRATALGARPVLVPAARVLHVGGAASTSAGKRVMLLRGQVTFLRLHWSPPRAALGRTLLAVGIAARAAGSRLTGRAGYWREVWRHRRTWLAGWPPTSELPPAEVTAPVPPGPRGTADPA
ncbi:glycosyltransferase family 2 protein [Plantactinospora sp. WMMC1484]|uniref:glycosyltransferase family 2 protein n=1 Tax=Plantactinospora sp. WMMC1484 TaxID=3404122 RepID=UPI003BF5DA7B